MCNTMFAMPCCMCNQKYLHTGAVSIQHQDAGIMLLGKPVIKVYDEIYIYTCTGLFYVGATCLAYISR